jgi:ATP-binding cassette, subfamily B, bacterial PglK
MSSSETVKSQNPKQMQNLFGALTYLAMSFSVTQRIKLGLVVLAQIFLAGFDLVGVILIGSLGTLAIANLQNQTLPSSIQQFFEYLPSAPVSLQSQMITLGGFATFFFIARTIIGMQLTRRILFFLSRQSAHASSELISRIFSSGILRIQSSSKQNYMFVITSGMNTLYIGILSNIVFILSDAILLFALFLLLLLADPQITIVTFVLLMAVGYLLTKYLKMRGMNLGDANTSIHIESLSKIDEVLDNYRENFVRNTLQNQTDILSHLRLRHSRVVAGMNYLPSITKYVFELSTVIFIFLISILAFIGSTTASAISTISVFFVASTRIAPAVLRIQNSIISVGTSLGVAQSTLSLLKELDLKTHAYNREKKITSESTLFVGTVELKQVTFVYPKTNSPIISCADLRIDHGSFVAIVGPSGSGKSTLIDLILGVVSPTFGDVKISGVDSTLVPGRFPGKVGFLPQNPKLFSGTLRDNITMGFPKDHFSYEDIMVALELAQASEFVSSLSEGLDTLIGENGIMLSGGQTQRVGIARTLVTSPSLIIFDEPTSSLDNKTEIEVSNSIYSLKGNRTVVVIAHELSTIKNADKVVLINPKGELVEGTYSEIEKLEPDMFKLTL